jgi:hypothetical protein
MYLCMRTTLDLDDELLMEAKRRAVEGGQTLTAFMEDALREVLRRRAPVAARHPTFLPTFRGGGLQPGVDLDDSAGLLDMMERS